MTPSRDGFLDVGFGKLDTDRADRTGAPETVLADGKTTADTIKALQFLGEAHPDRAVLATRCDDATRAAAREAFGDSADVDDVARTVVLGNPGPAAGSVCVVSAGTADAPVAREALVTARVHGAAATRVNDVGVAGVHRLFAHLAEIRRADVVVVVAGMDGALPSVVGGLVAAPVIAVPTSVGYGWSLDGLTAMLTMLNSCSPGVTVVNVDNGYGAGVAAARIAVQLDRARRR